MSDASSDPLDVQHQWYEPARKRRRSHSALLVRRLVIVALILVALTALVIFIIRFLTQSETYVVLLRARGLDVLHGPPASVAGHEIDLLEPLSGVANLKEFNGLLASPESLPALSRHLAELRLRPRDTLIIYIAAHGVSFDGQAKVVCENFDPRDPERGLKSADVILEAAKKSPAHTKLVIWDAGQIDYDPRLGILANQFPSLLEERVHQAKDSNLWVLCSHSDLQRSHHSYALDGSVFGTFVAAGLRGGATQNGRQLSVDELARFVTQRVSTWVSESTGGRSQQLPCLFHAVASSSDGGSPAEASGELDIKSTDAVDIQSLIEARKERLSRSPELLIVDGPRGYLMGLATSGQAGQATGGNADGTAAAIDATAADQPPSAGGEPDATSESDEQKDPRRRLAAILSAAWRVRDQLSAAAADAAPWGDRPVDTTPHLWRNLQEELIAYEQAIQSPSPGANVLSPESLQAALARFNVTKEDRQVVDSDLLRVRSPQSSPAASLLPFELPALRSLALAKLIASEFAGIDATRINQLQQTLDALINAAPLEFTQQIAELKPTGDYERFYELRLATQLGPVVAAEPELAQFALQVRRHGEEVAAATLWCAPWINESMNQADRLRLAGERQMLDQIGTDWPARARQALENADNKYAEAAAIAADVGRAIELCDEQLFAAPYCVRLFRESGQSESSAADQAKLKSWLELLHRLTQLLDNPSSAHVDEVRHLSAELSSPEWAATAAGFSQPRIERIVAGSDAANAWLMRSMLQTPLPSARIRAQLLAVVGQLDVDLAEGFRLAGATTDRDAPDWDRQYGLWELDRALAQLASDTAEADAPAEEFSLPASPRRNDEQFDQKKLKVFCDAIRNHYQALKSRVADFVPPPSHASVEQARRQTALARRALQLLDARDAELLAGVSTSQFTKNLDLHELLAWHAQRFEAAKTDAHGPELAYLEKGAAYYATQAARILRPQSLVSDAPEIEVIAPSQCSLVVDSEATLPIDLKYRGPGRADVWAVVEYDDRLIEVLEQPGLYVETHRSEAYPFRPAGKNSPATVSGIVRGQSHRLNVHVWSRPGAERDGVLIVKALTRDHAPPGSSGAAPVADPQSEHDVQPIRTYVRHTINVPIRVLEVVLDGPPNAWTDHGDQLDLHTFPNRVTDFRFGMANHGRADRDVALRFFPLPTNADWPTLSSADKRELLSRLKPVGRLAISVPADGATHFAGEADPPAPLPPAPAAPAAPAEEEAQKPPAGPALGRGMIVEVSDPKDPSQTFYRQVRVTAQRPRRYVRPRVEYNARLQRIEVTVRPRADRLLPAGPVKVECDLADDVDTLAEGKLRDFLSGPDSEARLFVNVPASPARTVTLYLHVDDYPRAFIYRVPIGGGVADLPEGVSQAAVRLLKATPGEYQAPAPVTLVVAQVDSPSGAFDANDDYVQMALDENLDEKFGPELSASFDEDRQANCYLENLGPDGVVSIDTRVGDYQVPLITDHLQNVKIKVHGRMSVDGRPVEAEPVTLKIDGAGPRISYVSVSPWGGFVLAGTDLQVEVTAGDSMSGVKTVEVGFDLEGTGAFSEKAPHIVAILDPATQIVPPRGGPLSVVGPPTNAGTAAEDPAPQRWLATLPTKDVLGVQTLLVRAIDGAGNPSDYYSKRVQILTPDQAAAKVQEQYPKVVEGIVVFRDRPVPSKLTLFSVPTKEQIDAAAAVGEPAPQQEQVAAATAGENGQFTLSGVAPGKYRLSAEGVVNNRPRFGEREVVVELSPGRVVRADLKLQ